jgi:hypothetical protein
VNRRQAAAIAKAKDEFPDMLYVVRQVEEDSVFFVADEDFESLGDDVEIVAAYALRGVHRLRRKVTLEDVE